jgi:uncharacterized repeat protein (TIGR01451 family)
MLGCFPHWIRLERTVPSPTPRALPVETHWNMMNYSKSSSAGPRRHDRPIRRPRSRPPGFELLEARELLTGYMVTSLADNGNNSSPSPGSLRAAILAADADKTPGAATISFAIPGGGVRTIAVPTSLPAIVRPVVIDGGTQPGYSPANTPLVVIDGSGSDAGASGLTFSAGSGSVVRGLSIVGFATNGGNGGAAIDVQAQSGNNLIEGAYLGIEPDGSTARANYYGIVVASPNNSIGGTGASARNVISGNSNAGVFVVGVGATGNVVSGNDIGTNAAGTSAVGNLYGVALGGPGNVVGGTSPGSGNLISGNAGPTGGTGIGILFELYSVGNVVEGNKIGTDATGSTALPNTSGVYFGTPGGSAFDSIVLDTVGGTVSGAGNLISGNTIGIAGSTTAALIAGNIIGLDAAGNVPVPNGDGILLTANGSTIGGTIDAARNVISGNSAASGADGTGIDLTGNLDVVSRNYIGLTSAGLKGAGVGNVVGLSLHVTHSTIGGTDGRSTNEISGNSGDGIAIDDGVGNFIVGNDISSNGGNGINLTIAAPASTPTSPLALDLMIGGKEVDTGNEIFSPNNQISGNGGAGIVVHDHYPTGITGLSIRENTISGNARLGIDLTGTGIPLPSTLFVTSINMLHGFMFADGVIFGAPNTTYAIDVFANGADPSGYGQGPILFESNPLFPGTSGGGSATTNLSGFAMFGASFLPEVPPFTSYSATATGPDGNTTEFSANFPTSLNGPRADLSIASAASASTIVAGTTVTFTETITNNGPDVANDVMLADTLPTGLVNAQVTTSAGTATIDTNNILSANLGSLASGQSATVTITGTALQTGLVFDSPGVSSTTFDTDYSNNQAQRSITVQPPASGPTADLGITMVASPTTGTVGATLTYTVTVTNLGPDPSTNTTFDDLLPPGVAYVGAIPSQGGPASLDGGHLTGNLGTIAAGASATLTIVVTPTAAGAITNAANVTGDDFDPAAGNNRATLTTMVTPAIPNINLAISQATSASPGLVGQAQYFVIKASNLGTGPATHVTVVDTLPRDVTIVGAVPSQGDAATFVGDFLVEDLGTLAAGASATLTLIVRPRSTGLLVNGAGVYTPDVPSLAPIIAQNGVISITI